MMGHKEPKDYFYSACTLGAVLLLLYWTFRPVTHARPLLMVLFLVTFVAGIFGLLAQCMVFYALCLTPTDDASPSTYPGLLMCAVAFLFLLLVVVSSWKLFKALGYDPKLRQYFDLKPITDESG